MQERSDIGTLIPMMEKLKSLGYIKLVADAGFESEENYTWCENNGQMAFIKPANHDRAKTKKYKSDIGKRENMPYDAENDAYICHAGHNLSATTKNKRVTLRLRINVLRHALHRCFFMVPVLTNLWCQDSASPSRCGVCLCLPS